MIIKRNDTLSLVEFDELQCGDVFIETYDGSEIIQMKTDAIGDDYGEIYNAILLASGELCSVSPHTKVRKVEAELIIK